MGIKILEELKDIIGGKKEVFKQEEPGGKQHFTDPNLPWKILIFSTTDKNYRANDEAYQNFEVNQQALFKRLVGLAKSGKTEALDRDATLLKNNTIGQCEVVNTVRAGDSFQTALRNLPDSVKKGVDIVLIFSDDNEALSSALKVEYLPKGAKCYLVNPLDNEGKPELKLDEVTSGLGIETVDDQPGKESEMLTRLFQAVVDEHKKAPQGPEQHMARADKGG